MKIVECRDRSCENWAEHRISEDVDDEASVERVEDEGAVVQCEKKMGDPTQPGASPMSAPNVGLPYRCPCGPAQRRQDCRMCDASPALSHQKSA